MSPSARQHLARHGSDAVPGLALSFFSSSWNVLFTSTALVCHFSKAVGGGPGGSTRGSVAVFELEDSPV
jgi:hypothetical protein